MTASILLWWSWAVVTGAVAAAVWLIRKFTSPEPQKAETSVLQFPATRRRIRFLWKRGREFLLVLIVGALMALVLYIVLYLFS